MSKTMPEAVVARQIWLSIRANPSFFWKNSVHVGQLIYAWNYKPRLTDILAKPEDLLHVISYDAYSALKAECERLERNLEQKSMEIGRSEHRGNTVDFIYDKVKIYSDLIGNLQSKNAALVAERDKAIADLATMNLYRISANKERNLIEIENTDFRTALEFYADKDKWSDFISDGNVFDEQDGDFVEAFNAMNGDMDQGQTARDVLSKYEKKETKT